MFVNVTDCQGQNNRLTVWVKQELRSFRKTEHHVLEKIRKTVMLCQPDRLHSSLYLFWCLFSLFSPQIYFYSICCWIKNFCLEKKGAKRKAFHSPSAINSITETALFYYRWLWGLTEMCEVFTESNQTDW